MHYGINGALGDGLGAFSRTFVAGDRTMTARFFNDILAEFPSIDHNKLVTLKLTFLLILTKLSTGKDTANLTPPLLTAIYTSKIRSRGQRPVIRTFSYPNFSRGSP